MVAPPPAGSGAGDGTGRGVAAAGGIAGGATRRSASPGRRATSVGGLGWARLGAGRAGAAGVGVGVGVAIGVANAADGGCIDDSDCSTGAAGGVAAGLAGAGAEATCAGGAVGRGGSVSRSSEMLVGSSSVARARCATP